MANHPALQTLLERQRYQGGKHARKLKGVAPDTAESPGDTAGAFLEFWREEVSTCFRKEEEVLLPVMARYGQDVHQDPLLEMGAQHASIRGLIMELSDEVMRDDIKSETLSKLGRSLEAHIQLKEQRVYPAIQNALPEAALREIASRLRVFDKGDHRESWVPDPEGVSFDPWPGPGDSEGGGWDYPPR